MHYLFVAAGIATSFFATFVSGTPVHLVLPNVVTLQNGEAVTLYSPASSTSASDGIISINQEMLLHAWGSHSGSESYPEDISHVLPDLNVVSPYQHNKNLDAVAPLIADDMEIPDPGLLDSFTSSSDKSTSITTSITKETTSTSTPSTKAIITSHTKTTSISIEIESFGSLDISTLAKSTSHTTSSTTTTGSTSTSTSTSSVTGTSATFHSSTSEMSIPAGIFDVFSSHTKNTLSSSLKSVSTSMSASTSSAISTFSSSSSETPTSSNPVTSTTSTVVGSPLLSSKPSSDWIPGFALTPTLQQIGTLSMNYPFTTSIPLIIGSPKSLQTTSSLFETGSESSETTTPHSSSPNTSSSATKEQHTSPSTEYSALLSSATATVSSSAPSESPFTSRVTNPLTLFSNDVVEVMISRATTPPPSSTILSTKNDMLPLLGGETKGFDWPSSSTSPISSEATATSSPPADTSTTDLLKRRDPTFLFARNELSDNKDTSIDAVRSAQSLIAAMKDVATRADGDSPERQSQINVIRSVLGQQIIYPDDEDDSGDDCNNDKVYTGKKYTGVPHPCTYQHTTIIQTIVPPIPCTTCTPPPSSPSPSPTSTSSSIPTFSVTIVATTTTTATQTTTDVTSTTTTTIATSTTVASSTTTVVRTTTTTSTVTTSVLRP